MIPFIWKCVLIGLCGTLISLLAVNYNLSKKAKAANLIYSFKAFMVTDWFAPAISVLAIIMASIGLPYIPATWQNSQGSILIAFATIGYSGNDLVSRFFSVVNQRINSSIDYKTTISDTATGTLDAPTPTSPLKKDVTKN